MSLLDAADALAVLNADFGIASVAPSRAPRVSNEIVRLSALCAVADGYDSVVEFGSAGRAGDHATFVVLEDFRLTIDIHRDRLSSNGTLKLAGVVLLNALVTGSLH